MAKKILDKKGRWRTKTVAFRVSPEEWTQFEKAVELSGLTKQDYLIERITQRDIVVQGNQRVYKALRDTLADVQVQLQEIQSYKKEIDTDLLETINLIAITLNGLKEV